MGQTSSSGVKAHMETAQKTGILVLSNRKLTEMPDLSTISKVVRTLDLSMNKLTGLPSSVCDLSNLKHLNLNGNKISSLPDETGRLTKLESISLVSNLIVTLPASMSDLKHLKSVILSDNKLTEFPVVLCGLPQLDVLDLSGNHITAVPDGIEELQAVELNLNMNQISAISPTVASCPRLKTLRLEENCLAISSIPQELLVDSQVSLVCVDGNLFKMKEFEEIEGYSKYMERYTAVKKKMF
ncbi:leucine-rich repeat-containing protein 57-like [Homarus americanus]|uniref:Leucine-rich repeat-containing protein 57-like n=1 Tax=Homarus americanus TaxID=6706 RepID=A0A8J5JVL2_HOMAM|nr:leucine-rich repeat-containing protein 57-like [Homarus americanus]KAG7160059.1 Leucine-rich repeat-containing protein 57-like [Homarus americanus]